MLRAADSGWEPKTRDELLQLTARFSNRPSIPSSAPGAPEAPARVSAPPVVAVDGLSPEEQRTFETARAELSAGHAVHARELAAPLVARHATLSAVQSLRCETAMAIGGDWDTISAECPGLSPFGAK